MQGQNQPELDSCCAHISCLLYDNLTKKRCVCAHINGFAGHYVSLIKSHATWLFFDDDNVETITESQVQSTFGSTQEYGNNNMDHGKSCALNVFLAYILCQSGRALLESWDLKTWGQ